MSDDAKLRDMSLLLSIEEARLVETDGAARGETKLAWAIPSRDRGRQSQTPPGNEGTE